jgi:hypothetical protein
MKPHAWGSPPVHRRTRTIWTRGAFVALLVAISLAGFGCNDSVRREVRQGALGVATNGVDSLVSGLNSIIDQALQDVANPPTSSPTQP